MNEPQPGFCDSEASQIDTTAFIQGTWSIISVFVFQSGNSQIYIFISAILYYTILPTSSIYKCYIIISITTIYISSLTIIPSSSSSFSQSQTSLPLLNPSSPSHPQNHPPLLLLLLLPTTPVPHTQPVPLHLSLKQ